MDPPSDCRRPGVLAEPRKDCRGVLCRDWCSTSCTADCGISCRDGCVVSCTDWCGVPRRDVRGVPRKDCIGVSRKELRGVLGSEERPEGVAATLDGTVVDIDTEVTVAGTLEGTFEVVDIATEFTDAGTLEGTLEVVDIVTGAVTVAGTLEGTFEVADNATGVVTVVRYPGRGDENGVVNLGDGGGSVAEPLKIGSAATTVLRHEDRRAAILGDGGGGVAEPWKVGVSCCCNSKASVCTSLYTGAGETGIPTSLYTGAGETGILIVGLGRTTGGTELGLGEKLTLSSRSSRAGSCPGRLAGK